ncbi:hypothetical protein ACHAXA_000564 [Cyclostephanos tholiformis]|uniref:DUF1995 domain-containing protein n=1 Tax=Cyclostephanos tholiformis TaxID=382380 RepID=A0ABD3SST9_9STRA
MFTSIAANACHQIHLASGGTTVRCRVDFDTSVGDETYTLLKSSTEFTQKFVSALCLACVDGVMEWRMGCSTRLANARAELIELRREMEEIGSTNDDDDVEGDGYGDFLDEDGSVVVIDEVGADDMCDMKSTGVVNAEARRKVIVEMETELLKLIANDGRDGAPWNGPRVRVYFPDEGSAALARRDWSTSVPPCVEFASCGGVQVSNTSSDVIVLFCCPRASEAEYVEKILYDIESSRGDGLLMSIMLNPLLVDMGVTGFGMAGRRLRERLIDGLVPAYYLRTLPWGALTRAWPRLFTVWKEDEDAEGGYTMIQAMDRLPSNPEVEDIYDISNGDMSAPKDGFGFLNSLGDFVNGMMRL